MSLLRIALLVGLVVMVMFSGYEAFVSRIDIDAAGEKLGWLAKLDTGSLKIKVAAISSIQPLRVFMDTAQPPDRTLKS